MDKCQILTDNIIYSVTDNTIMFSMDYDKMLDQLEPEVFEKNMKQSAMLFRGITALGLVVCAISFIWNPDPKTWESDVLFLLLVMSMVGMMFILTLRSSARKIRRRIAKCLAGIECGEYHGVDDLVFYADIDRELATRIIKGEYDFLLSSVDTCRYMP